MCAEFRAQADAAARAGRSQRAQRGLSLVEIMVGMIVALLVSLAASSGATVFTSSQRQGIGAGGITVNAATALSAIKSDAASAGLGFFGDSAFRCTALDLSVGATLKMNAASFAPVRITAGSGNDQLDVMSASNVDSGANVLLKGNSDGSSASLMSLLPVTSADVGKAVLLAPGSTAGTCMVRTITAVTAATDDTPQSLTFANTGTYNGATFTTPVSYVEKDRVALLDTLRWSRYSVGNDRKLTLTHPLDDSSAVLVSNVMAFRVQYGIVATTAGATTLTGWQDATAGTIWASVSGTDFERVRALRIGLVTRSSQREKENKNTGVCDASASMPTLFGSTVTPDVTDWKCYRYRSAIVVVPLRNMIW
jgi:type IV pilus assembly protein PilW